MFFLSRSQSILFQRSNCNCDFLNIVICEKLTDNKSADDEFRDAFDRQFIVVGITKQTKRKVVIQIFGKLSFLILKELGLEAIRSQLQSN